MDAEVIVEERKQPHGDADKTFRLAGSLTTEMLMAKDGCDITPHEFALINIQHKIARIVCGNFHPDHWDDIIGYALLGKEQHRKASENK